MAASTGLGLAAVLGLTVSAVGALADENHAPHVHGAGTLKIAVEEGRVEIEVLLPGLDVVGFEHSVVSPEQKRQVDEAVETLSKGAALFILPEDATCRQERVEVTAPDTHGDDRVEHPTTDEETTEREHADFHAHYHFTCGNPTAASHMSVALFSFFPSVHELETQVISAKGQNAYELTPGNALVPF